MRFIEHYFLGVNNALGKDSRPIKNLMLVIKDDIRNMSTNMGNS